MTEERSLSTPKSCEESTINSILSPVLGNVCCAYNSRGSVVNNRRHFHYFRQKGCFTGNSELKYSLEGWEEQALHWPPGTTPRTILQTLASKGTESGSCCSNCHPQDHCRSWTLAAFQASGGHHCGCWLQEVATQAAVCWGEIVAQPLQGHTVPTNSTRGKWRSPASPLLPPLNLAPHTGLTSMHLMGQT